MNKFYNNCILSDDLKKLNDKFKFIEDIFDDKKLMKKIYGKVKYIFEDIYHEIF